MSKSEGLSAQDRFVQELPRIERVIRHDMRHQRNRTEREELVCEALALAWKYWVRCADAGKEPWTYTTTVAHFAARHARQGRTAAAGKIRASTVYREKVRPCASLQYSVLDGRVSPADAAALRIDYPAWLDTWDERRRKVIELLAAGEPTHVVADQCDLSASRVSQLRTYFKDCWEVYTS